MSMTKQPDGVPRAPRGPERPPREYDIHYTPPGGSKFFLGMVERRPKGVWRAFPATPPAEGDPWQDVKGYNPCLEFLLETWRGQQGTSETASAEDGGESVEVVPDEVPAGPLDPPPGAPESSATTTSGAGTAQSPAPDGTPFEEGEYEAATTTPADMFDQPEPPMTITVEPGGECDGHHMTMQEIADAERALTPAPRRPVDVDDLSWITTPATLPEDELFF